MLMLGLGLRTLRLRGYNPLILPPSYCSLSLCLAGPNSFPSVPHAPSYATMHLPPRGKRKRLRRLHALHLLKHQCGVRLSFWLNLFHRKGWIFAESDHTPKLALVIVVQISWSCFVHFTPSWATPGTPNIHPTTHLSHRLTLDCVGSINRQPTRSQSRHG